MATMDTGMGGSEGMGDLGMGPREGQTTRNIDYQTAKMPSTAFLLAAGLSVAGSLALFALRRPISAIFVGLWPPTFLLLGNYNKMIKLFNEYAGNASGYSAMH